MRRQYTTDDATPKESKRNGSSTAGRQYDTFSSFACGSMVRADRWCAVFSARSAEKTAHIKM